MGARRDVLSYQWQRCDVDALQCLNVGGATGETYGVRNADVGYRLRALVTARNAQGAGTATSNVSDVVDPAVAPNSRPTISFISVVFRGNRVYARFRACDDGGRAISPCSRPNHDRAVSR